MKNKKEFTLNDLALMVAKGFENTATKEAVELINKRIDQVKISITSLKEKIEEIDAKIDSIDRQIQAIFKAFGYFSNCFFNPIVKQ